MDQWEEEKPVSEITLAEFEKLCNRVFEQKGVVDAAQAVADEESAKLEELKRQVLAAFEKNGMEKFACGAGTVYAVDRFSVQTPKTIEQKKLLFNYLREKGIFLEMASVNSQTLNSFYKAEMDNAVKAGNVDFKVPGIGEPAHTRTLNMRKA